ncbi:procathepsin L-like [Tribolium madens]|uniref:procathepsin L-like n=1 Tax=Tribolium madens TaxID=41895 RepID=UPI001CF73580|nr:procathepsin L-like [Tribolium madens]
METFVIILITVSATLASPQRTINDQTWSKFKQTHNKEYSTKTEEVKRLAIFRENLSKIEAHNTRFKNGEVTYFKAMNKFSDLTTDEFLAFINRNKLTKQEKNYQNLKKINSTKIEQYESQVDWRSNGLVSEVKNEAACSSSWSFSAIGAVEGQLALKTNQLTSLSEQNLIDCSADFGNNGCNGGFATNAYSYVSQQGIMSENDYPYEGKSNVCRFDASKSVTTVTGYYDIDANDEISLQNTIAMMGPVAATVEATEELQFYSGGILLDEKCNNKVPDLNHGVLVVGYGTKDENDFWIIKNSWGSKWGEEGYYRLVRNHGNNCGIATSATLPIL